jgi:hypothetical protein
MSRMRRPLILTACILLALFVMPAGALKVGPQGTSPSGLLTARPESLGRNTPPLRIETLVNFIEADEPSQAVEVGIGETLGFTHIVTNGGTALLTSVSVGDDTGTEVSCPQTTLNPGESMTCTSRAFAASCLQVNTGSATAAGANGKAITARDRAYYFGIYKSAVTIEKRVNGEDADDRPGPYITPGDMIAWTFVVTNSGAVDLHNIKVVDNGVPKVFCPKTLLLPDESMTCTAESSALAGQQDNLATVSAYPPCGAPVTDDDAAHYLGSVTRPSVALVKSVNGQDANTAPGPSVSIGSALFWTFVVTNSGDVRLTGVAVTYDSLTVTCPKSVLAAGESMTCTAQSAALACEQQNTASVSGYPDSGGVVYDQDPAFYTGAPFLDLRLETRVNGEEADTAPGLTVQAGSSLSLTYAVTNAGDVALTGLSVTASDGPAVACPKTALQSGETMMCSASMSARGGERVVIGSVSGTPPCGPKASATDSAYYKGVGPSISIETLVNGGDADQEPGLYILKDAPIVFSYVVTNSGDVALTGVSVTDDRGLIVTCPKTTLSIAESMVCTATSTAVSGHSVNVGTASGTAVSTTVQDSDPAHYTGIFPAVAIETLTNGSEADDPPGPSVVNGRSVQWTYVVTNTGDVSLSSLSVTDDQGVPVTCPKTVLQAGEAMTCTASGIASGGQHSNVGTVTGTPPAGANVTASDPSHYVGIAGQGCTPGYWKNHTDSWPPTGYSPTQKIKTVFTSVLTGYPPSIGNATLWDALAFDGYDPNPVAGGGEILLRAGVAALLNASHPSVSFPLTEVDLITQVNTALASANRDVLLTNAAQLDAQNNTGCPLN